MSCLWSRVQFVYALIPLLPPTDRRPPISFKIKYDLPSLIDHGHPCVSPCLALSLSLSVSLDSTCVSLAHHFGWDPCGEGEELLASVITIHMLISVGKLSWWTR